MLAATVKSGRGLSALTAGPAADDRCRTAACLCIDVHRNLNVHPRLHSEAAQCQDQAQSSDFEIRTVVAGHSSS
mgnify:CR=1 FL=1